jgi:hypothetical protein
MSKSPERQKTSVTRGSNGSLLSSKRASQLLSVPVPAVEKKVKVHDKYFLRTLHEEIDLYDRKLAHLAKYEPFASDVEREEALGKMTVKRDTLARTARKLMDEGIEFRPSDLPRSFRPAPGDA